MRFALPGERVEFPLAIAGGGDSLSLSVGVGAATRLPSEPARDAHRRADVAPMRPGFYHLALHPRRDARDRRRAVARGDGAVRARSSAIRLNGYRIGTYLAERFGGALRPSRRVRRGAAGDARSAVTQAPQARRLRHARRPGDVWPKYVALNPRLLDKLELVFADLGCARRGPDARRGRALRLPHAVAQPRVRARGARQPPPVRRRRRRRDRRQRRRPHHDHRRAARDAAPSSASRSEHPDLVGGLGLYTSRRYRTPYVHIDARGKRARWRG